MRMAMIHAFPLLAAILVSACGPSTSTSPQASAEAAADSGQLHGSVDARASTPSLRRCLGDDLLGLTPEGDAVEAHRRFEMPTLHYPFGTRPANWQYELTLRIDERGRVACYATTDQYGKAQPLTAQRASLIAALSAWSYTPFERDGRIVPSIITEYVREQEDPARHVAAPALADAEITLERSGCYGTCPAYRVTVRSDGSAVYAGQGFVDVAGIHRYEVPPGEVAALVAQAAHDDLWSLREDYSSDWTDNPTYVVTLRVGRTEHRIVDYIGADAGMPAVVTRFEEAVDRVARSASWTVLSAEAVAALEAEGFDFRSQQAGLMLANAVANDKGEDEAAMVRLVELGVPLVVETGYFRSTAPAPKPDAQAAIRNALRHGRAAVAEAMLVRKPLPRERAARQAAIDEAFLAALAGGNLDAIAHAWGLDAALPPSPFATVKDEDDEDAKPQRIPACLQLRRPWPRAKPWDGVAVVKWLEAHGCDVAGRGMHGDTLLHVAADADDVPLTRYLLERGVDPNARGQFDLPPLGSASNEEVAIALLEAGSTAVMGDDKYPFRGQAVEKHWERVVAWLDAHPEIQRDR